MNFRRKWMTIGMLLVCLLLSLGSIGLNASSAPAQAPAPVQIAQAVAPAPIVAPAPQKISKPVAAVPSDQDLLAITIYREARGEPIEGQMQVGFVILERTRHTQWPHTVGAVVLQKHNGICQFTSWCLRHAAKFEPASWELAQREAAWLMAGTVQDSLHATCYDTVEHPKWGTMVGKVGRHFFYDCARKDTWKKSSSVSPPTAHNSAISASSTITAQSFSAPSLVSENPITKPRSNITTSSAFQSIPTATRLWAITFRQGSAPMPRPETWETA
jgi:hypothetical protein